MGRSRAVKTLNHETEEELRSIGPLGPLHTADVAAMRNDLPFDAGGQYEPTEEDRLNSVLSEVGSSGGNGVISIWKLSEQNKEWEFVAKRDVAGFENEGLPFLAREFGPGSYELRIYNSSKKIHARPKVVISKAAALYAQADRVAEPSGGSDITQLGKIMIEGFGKLGELIVSQRAAPAPQESRSAFLAEMLQMKQLFAGDARGSDPLDMFSKMLPIFKSMAPGAEPENPLISVMDRFMPIIGEAYASAKANAAAAPAIPATPSTQPVRQIQAGAPVNAAPAHPPTPEQIGASQMSLALKMQLAYLCSQAKRDSDPAPFAAIIVGDVPREALDKLLNSANWLDELAKFEPKVKQHAEWFEELKEAVEDQLNPDLTDEPNSDIQAANLRTEATNVPVGNDDSDGDET